ncbi:MAG TPA: glycosyltransferase [Lentibacillus sp.]|uniref:glycosyltransferase family 2 protein n=1 Tax=Lentibacillus sp. TaxID=1925746 RepID=UPI002B4B7F86|nr:glycosyltransferase [Lentibacillus sp.]HLR62768.1 glycosyltransferase [Lentibacillus sp.]
MLQLTIIIPHYNSTASLSRLLGTIPCLGDVQIIVIDDHSDESHQQELNRIRKRNAHRNMTMFRNDPDKKGAGACRNIGLQHAEGKWILFADADDYFMEGFYDVIQTNFRSPADIIFFKPTSIEADTGNISDRHLSFVNLIEDAARAPYSKEAELSLRYKFIVPWSKLVRTSFIKEHDISFDEVISANDVMFSTKAGYYLDAFDLSDEVIYCATTNKGSLTKTINNDVFDTRLNVFINQYRFLQEHLPETDFKKLGLSGRPLLIKAADLGLKKAITVFFKLKRHKVLMIEPKLFNPLWFFRKALFVYQKQKRERDYHRKG